MLLPASSYSCFDIHICWNVPSDASIEPPTWFGIRYEKVSWSPKNNFQSLPMRRVSSPPPPWRTSAWTSCWRGPSWRGRGSAARWSPTYKWDIWSVVCYQIMWPLVTSFCHTNWNWPAGGCCRPWRWRCCRAAAAGPCRTFLRCKK